MDFRSGHDGAAAIGEATPALPLASPARQKGAAMTMDRQNLDEAALVEAMASAAAASAPPKDDSKSVNDRRFAIAVDQGRDALLTDFGKDTLDDRYLLPGETYQDL